MVMALAVTASGSTLNPKNMTLRLSGMPPGFTINKAATGYTRNPKDKSHGFLIGYGFVAEKHGGLADLGTGPFVVDSIAMVYTNQSGLYLRTDARAVNPRTRINACLRVVVMGVTAVVRPCRPVHDE
jgi:hypothetical protein